MERSDKVCVCEFSVYCMWAKIECAHEWFAILKPEVCFHRAWLDLLVCVGSWRRDKACLVSTNT